MKREHRATSALMRDMSRNRRARRVAVRGLPFTLLVAPIEGRTITGVVTPARNVGNAVARNQVRRRLRVILGGIVRDYPQGYFITVLAHRGSAEVGLEDLAGVRRSFDEWASRSAR